MKKKVLLLTSSLLTDRMLIYSGFLERIKEEVDLTIWASSKNVEESASAWNGVDVHVESFPKIYPYKEFPYNHLRRLNDFVWNYKQKISSRVSIQRHTRDANQSLLIKSLKIPGWILAKLGLEEWFENFLEKKLIRYNRSEEATERLKKIQPDLVVSLNPFWFNEPAIIARCKKMNIPVYAFISSWDNITTKNRMVFKYDGYMVWSDEQKEQLIKFYPDSRGKNIYITGAPQYDVFFDDKFYITKEEFCRQYGLVTDLPIILCAVGSPNFIHHEEEATIELIKELKTGKYGKFQIIVRPHPVHDNGKLANIESNESVKVVLQNPNKSDLKAEFRTMDSSKIVNWINTFRHSDVVVQLFSTVAIDASFFDKPIVNFNFDPDREKKQEILIKELNETWVHFSPIYKSGAMYNAQNQKEILDGVLWCLSNPDKQKKEREWIKNFVTQYPDGKCAVRLAEAMLKFVAE